MTGWDSASYMMGEILCTWWIHRMRLITSSSVSSGETAGKLPMSPRSPAAQGSGFIAQDFDFFGGECIGDYEVSIFAVKSHVVFGDAGGGFFGDGCH